ncbi:RsmB/NOP family class I SAM-dependent RNA methyltransferase [Methyloversatilis sp. XJ19-49]|uniref:RsmB/NOP family class I SAM-dependent RNA methyltransferase n=1 Tax=Methyloversatilis sp. XJ19-49 TaxID=2963429 RepID=UPI00211C18BD|nr:RsmB/NOP family class I SAM-dependent RNA methyltransferase [Methyloversatilis sp. XJ19-49]MCQ9378396.1 RsmB/NOP family class I SAM-dependent RNA methyltransferase [Methyloversatilis sp. XJ19-49]
MKPTEKLIDSTADVLSRMLRFEHTADSVLSAHFRDQRALQSRERAFVAEHAYLVLRRLRWLRAVAGENAGARKLLITALARIEGLGHKFLAPLISRNEAQWLETLAPTADTELSLGERTDLPDWVIERLLTQMDEASLLSLARALNTQAPLDLRVNLMKSDIEAVTATLTNNGLTVTPGRFSPWALRLGERPSLTKNPLYEKGIIEVQDEGSQLLALLLAPKRGEMVVDFCAGAGGKTLALGAMMRSTGRLYAFDVSEKRLIKMRPRVARSGLSNIHPVLIDSENDIKVKRLAGKIDRVLVDAPCSGLGTLRRNPDLKWRQTPTAVEELVVKQGAILAGAARLVKPGGRLVYATCSLLDAENRCVIDTFLASHPDFVRLPANEILAAGRIDLDTGIDLELRPDIHGTDGFYAAVMERRAPNSAATTPETVDEA